MTIHRDHRIMPFEASLIEKIVLDVEKYPEFLPWCQNATLISRDQNQLIADLKITFKGFSESYRSMVKWVQEEEVVIIHIDAISGPFKHLSTIWSIKKLNKTSEVNFFIDFELKSRILGLVVGGLFSIATEKMIIAFEERARNISNA